jgi:hypothetical protein
VFEEELRRYLMLEQRPTPVALVHWVVTGSWPDPGVRVDVAFAPSRTIPLF